MRPRHPVVGLLLALCFVLSCSGSDAPSQLTGPGAARHDLIANLACPIALPQGPLSVAPGGTLNFQLTATGPVTAYGIGSAPAHGTLVVQAASGIGTYTPSAGYTGPDSFTFGVFSELCGWSPDVTVLINVAVQNECPTASNSSVTVPPDAATLIQLDVQDPDNNLVGLSIVSQPSHGALGPGSGITDVMYTPAAGYTGPDSFQFRMTDGICESNVATVSINVVAPDDDGDGVPDADDDCDDSDLDATVAIDGCDSGVANPVDESGCSLADKVASEVAAAGATATTHGKFVSAMAKRLKSMVDAGVITPAERDALMSCVGSSSYSKSN